jgi:hypothetical protein
MSFGSGQRPPRYRQHLQAAVATSAAPYGYTLTIWTSGAVTANARGLPSTWEALVFLAGAVTGFALMGAVAYGSLARIVSVEGGRAVRLWGSFHLPSVGLAIALATLIAHLIPEAAAWPMVGFSATAAYLALIAAQYTLAEAREADRVATASHAEPRVPSSARSRAPSDRMR